MSTTSISVLGLTIALLAVLYQVYLSTLLSVAGVFRKVETFGLDESACKRIPELQACEKIVLHQSTGILYLACSDLQSRRRWNPCADLLDVEGKSPTDYVATYDPKTSRITRLTFINFEGDLSVHGMDVVPSDIPGELYVYMVNHRAPQGQDPRVVGADSVIELFKTRVGGEQLHHVRTVADPVISTPNDVVGQADGKAFFFTNDHGSKVGFSRIWDAFFPTTTIGYCHLDHGCEVAASKIITSNGIARASNDTVYVASTFGGTIAVFHKQGVDNSLLLKDTIHIGQALDNLAIDSRGNLWVAAFPKLSDIFQQVKKDPSHIVPTAGFQISINTGPDSLRGQGYKVEKIFENNGTIASGSTSVVYDAERELLFMSGLTSSHLTVCHKLHGN
ncbi:hypothetical protein GYMLUDRAFT_45522 [Collybiopsis luxurians FD-317 M1]|uniref:SMP-30/Gluconolactonase/LRE-like region domain-containing protein n=1 Tax=Collybiopsis luxurians FD-317 M1 TaxID=944289 RepID=A0A0D0B4Q7_9AGAR|nr:hypothetical protein GYMLUDRAFT_45522 [Collybiopsis luxurians FD-317 M1]